MNTAPGSTTVQWIAATVTHHLMEINCIFRQNIHN